MNIFGKPTLCREISVQGANGSALVRIGDEVTIEFSDREPFLSLHEPVLALAETDDVIKRDGKWNIKRGRQAEICVFMDPALTDKDRDDWLKSHGAMKSADGTITSETPLPDAHLIYSLALVDGDGGEIIASPRANSVYNWSKRMSIKEAFSIDE